MLIKIVVSFFLTVSIHTNPLMASATTIINNTPLHTNIDQQMTLLRTVSALAVLLALLILILIKEYFKVKALTKDVYEKSIKDGLTGLYNRMALVDKYESEISSKTSLAIVDIDNFKVINDTFGHLIGDEVIQKIAEVIEHTMIGIGYAGRYGGEEFLIVVQNTDKTNPWEVAEALRLNVEAIRWSFRSEPITVSIGLLCRSKSSFDEGFKAVDHLLYEAKESGKNMTLTADCNIS